MCRGKKTKRTCCTGSIELIWSIVRRRKKNVCQPQSPPLSLFSSSINHDRRSKQSTFYANIDLRQNYKVQVDVKTTSLSWVQRLIWIHKYLNDECFHYFTARSIKSIEHRSYLNVRCYPIFTEVRHHPRSHHHQRDEDQSFIFLHVKSFSSLSLSDSQLNKCISWTSSSINNSILTLARSIDRSLVYLTTEIKFAWYLILLTRAERMFNRSVDMFKATPYSDSVRASVLNQRRFRLESAQLQNRHFQRRNLAHAYLVGFAIEMNQIVDNAWHRADCFNLKIENQFDTCVRHLRKESVGWFQRQNASNS